MDDHGNRLAALRDRVQGQPLYVSKLVNIRYLTGFTGSAAQLLVTADSATLFTDSRYAVQAPEQVKCADVRISSGDVRITLAAAARRLRLKRLRFEASHLDYETYSYLQGELPRCRLMPVRSVVERLRQVKSAAEIAAIRASLELNSAAFEDVCASLDGGWSEVRIAAELESAMRRRGAQGASFPTIVASGEHGARPHAEPRNLRIEPRALVVVDHGAKLGGYCSDMTRMVALGDPGAAQRELVRAVLEAQAAAIDAIRPGVQCRTVDGRAREVLKKSTVAGSRLDELFVHSTGHGLGLEIHEGPRIAPGQQQRLRPGMVVTVEPGVYVEGVAGVRIEDMVAVTESGCEVLTRTPRELRLL
ncbi:MAG: Xaa-Pro peptidase family protein [Bryobacterales bacterium]|nr:Xaa-Pro peptidase family protein [Bryobacterales bacterium]